MATCRISPFSCRQVKHAFHEDFKMAAACLQTAAMPHPLRPETDRSSYTNQPPTWQPYAFRQLLYHPLCTQKQIEVATQTSLQHGSCMPSGSCPQGFESPQKNISWCSTDVPQSYSEAGRVCLISVSFWQTWDCGELWMFQLLAPPSLQNDKCFSFLQNLDMPHDIPHIYICDLEK